MDSLLYYVNRSFPPIKFSPNLKKFPRLRLIYSFISKAEGILTPRLA